MSTPSQSVSKHDWGNDSVARMAKRVDKLQGPENIFTWLQDARIACPALDHRELLLYRQSGWSIERLTEFCRKSGSNLPFPTDFRENNERIVEAAFHKGETTAVSPSSTDSALASVSKEGEVERKNGAGMWTPAFAVLEYGVLQVYNSEAEYDRRKRSPTSRVPHEYSLAEAEAVCRLGREIHVFRCLGKLLRLRTTTSQLASEWVSAIAVAGAQFTKDDTLFAQSQAVLKSYQIQLRDHIDGARKKLQEEFEANIKNMATNKKDELQRLRKNLDDELERKKREYETTEDKFKKAIQDQAQQEAKERKEKESIKEELARRARAAFDPNNPDAVEVVGGFEVDSIGFLDREYKARLAHFASKLLDGDLNTTDKVLLNATAQGRTEEEEAEVLTKMSDAVPTIDVEKERKLMRQHVQHDAVLDQLEQDLEQRHRILLGNLHAQHKAAIEREEERHQQLLSLEKERLVQESQLRRVQRRAMEAAKRSRERALNQLNELQQAKHFETERVKIQQKVEFLSKENETLQDQLKNLEAEEKKLVVRLHEVERRGIANSLASAGMDSNLSDHKDIGQLEDATGQHVVDEPSLVRQLQQLCTSFVEDLRNDKYGKNFSSFATSVSYGRARNNLKKHTTQLQKIQSLIMRWQSKYTSRCEQTARRAQEENMASSRYHEKTWNTMSCGDMSSLLCLRDKARVQSILKAQEQASVSSTGTAAGAVDFLSGSPPLCSCLEEVLGPVRSFGHRLQHAVHEQDKKTQDLLTAIEKKQVSQIESALKYVKQRVSRGVAPEKALRDFWSTHGVEGPDPIPFLVNGPSLASLPPNNKSSGPLTALVHGQEEDSALRSIDSILNQRDDYGSTFTSDVLRSPAQLQDK